MVNGKSVAIVAIVACVIAVGAVLYTSLPYDEIVEYPESMMGLEKRVITPSFMVSYSYPDDMLYEELQFEVHVRNRETELPVECANVSFMIPEIYLLTNESGIVFFSTPKIQDRYLKDANASHVAFPLSVNKRGYQPFIKLIDVHLRK